jgi:hypothetical protein
MNNKYNKYEDVEEGSSDESNLNGELVDQLKKIKEEFYSSNRKKLFFTSSQKIACAESVCAEIDINVLLTNTIHIVENKNVVFFNYLIFKTYANDNNFHIINDYLFEKINNCIHNYGSFEMHFDLATFTVSAAERYKRLIELFVKKCLDKQTTFVNSTVNITIYNTPSMVEHINAIFKSLIHPVLKTKIVYYDKKASPRLMNLLLNSNENNGKTISSNI